MSKINFTSPWRINKLTQNFLFVLCFLTTLQLAAQPAPCSLACNGSVQISLDNSNCESEVTSAMILNDAATSCPDGEFLVTIEDHYGNFVAGYNVNDPNASTPPNVDFSHVGVPLYAKVTDTVSGNSCWGNLVVEDKLPPILSCTDVTIACYEAATFAPPAIDNCDVDAVITLVSDVVQVNDCSGALPENVLKVHTLTYIATDASGNTSLPCTMTATVERIDDLEDIHCPLNLLQSTDNNLVCDGNWAQIPDGPYAGNPLPRGFFQTKATFEGTHEDTDPTLPNNPNVVFDQFEFEYTPDTGTCDDVTFESSISGNMLIKDHEGNVLFNAMNTNPFTVTLCEDTRYILEKRRQVANTPIDYVITVTAAGDAGCYVPDVPHLPSGLSLYPDPDVYCNILTSFSDTDLGYIGCVRKIMRTWTILEWSCSDPQRSRTCVQMIEISDDIAPTFTCPADMTVTTNISGGSYNTPNNGVVSCARLMTPPAISPVDNCTNPIEIDIDYPNGFIDNYTGSEQMELPIGDNTITYTVYDGCYNSSSCSFVVTVEDNTPPVAICDQYTVVSLSVDGVAHIYASVFDDGSYDDCHLSHMLVKRMDDGENCNIVADTFEEYITVCCNDIDQTTMVQLRVYDLNGNYNECMVEVDVQDKIGPTIVCPDETTIYCHEAFDLNGDLVSQFGDFTVTDNCGFTIRDTAVANLNQCNVGTITRTITATDDGGRVSECVQIIDVVNPSVFDGTTDITWPVDVDMEGCANPASEDFHPDNTGYPTYLEDNCDLVGANYTDLTFPFNNGAGNACFKILRTWSVIDWCQFNGSSYPRWEWTQVIKINNTVDPVITSDCEAKSTCTYDITCQEGFIELTATATDDCTEELDWTVDLDFNNDGSFDDSVSGTGSLADASDDYPVGDHIAFYTFRDKCGNVTTCSQEFSIINCTTPTPYCINGLATDLMPVDTDGDGTPDWGMIELWASDFDLGSSHACGYPVVVSFSSDVTNTNMTFDCNTQGQQNVTIYATVVDANGDPLTLPDGSFLQDFCNTYVDIQDNTGACTNNVVNRNISGQITTEDNVTVMDAEVGLGDGINYEMTTQDGMYAFPAMPQGGAYSIDPIKDTDPMNGVSTLDLVLIQKHILGLADLPSAYKHIAADINLDGSISAVDLVELRKLILGIQADFTTNESWRFIDKSFTFDNTIDPLDQQFDEVYEISSLDTDMIVDFTAVKVGDVNNTVVANATSNEVSNRSGNMHLVTDNLSFVAGETVTVPMTIKSDEDLVGYQFTLNFDPSVLSYTGYESGQVALSDANFGTHAITNGVVTTSWNNDFAVTMSSDEAMFVMEFVAKTNGTLTNALSVGSEVTIAEAYNENQEVYNLDLQIRDAGENGYALYQNTPNPFNNNTQIGFDLPTAQNVNLTIYDVTGKVIKVINQDFESGYNTVNVKQSDLNISGVLYYTLDTKGFSATMKMVVLK